MSFCVFNLAKLTCKSSIAITICIFIIRIVSPRVYCVRCMSYVKFSYNHKNNKRIDILQTSRVLDKQTLNFQKYHDDHESFSTLYL